MVEIDYTKYFEQVKSYNLLIYSGYTTGTVSTYYYINLIYASHHIKAIEIQIGIQQMR